MTRRGSGRAVMMALSAAALLGCASGAVSGRVSLAGQQATPLTMTWNSGLFGGSGKMSAVMPDGERFSGKYHVVSPGTTRSSLEPAWTGDEPGENQGQIDDSMWGAGRDHFAFTKTFENKAVATLKGNRGTTMLCRFNLDSGGAGMGGGGTGECQTSKGAKISASF
jgi:hypothetical protein